MRAIRQHELGGPDVLCWEEVPDRSRARARCGSSSRRPAYTSSTRPSGRVRTPDDAAPGAAHDTRARRALPPGREAGGRPRRRPRRRGRGLGPRMLDVPGGIAALGREVLAAAADGSRVPYVGSVFPLAEAAQAHRALEARETTGKVVLVSARMDG
ncbi:zinc-binding dehydrogenase [Nocardioides cheoyonin]|uniref:zinc-binding dehydrogenase n=1 Tax=Nocardioides cheoyonin TaxID=3156615 RepID=UPI0032B333EB